MSPSSLLQDLRHSVRAIARAKGVTAVVLLSLALGTGANAAVYGVIDALLLHGPAGVEDPSRMVDIYTSELSGAPYGQSSYPDYLSVRTHAASFAAIAAVDDNAVENVRVGDTGVSARIAAVSEDFFPALRMQASAGRLLAAGDASVDPASAVISVRLSDLFGGADRILGKTLIIGEQPYSIVGVAPPRFRGLHVGRECDAWILMTRPAAARGDRRLSAVARLAGGVTVNEAEDDLRRISDDLAVRFPGTNRGSLFEPDAPRRITPVRSSQLDPAARDQVFLIGVVCGGASALLLASACLNVGSLLLARTVARRVELAIKLALGATRRRLVRQLVTETLFQSLAGGVLGLLFAIWTAGAIPALFMAEQAEMLDTRLDVRVLLMTVGIACLAGALFGIAPALQGTTFPEATALRADAGGLSAPQGGVRLRALLLSGQVALSTVLLLVTALLVTGLTHALEGALGSAARKVAVVSIELPGRFGDPVRGLTFRNTLLERLPRLGGVEAVGWASTLPLGRGNTLPFRIQGDSADVTDTVELDTNVVSPGYFRALTLSPIEGRLFDDSDTALSPPVVVVDELLARRYFGPTVAGRHLINAKGERLEVVGVVRSGRYRTLQQAPQPTVYYPSAQDYLWRGHLIVRTTREPADMLDAIRETVQGTGEGANVLQASTLETYLSDSLALDRVTTTLVGLCGLVALVMSTIGVYGVMTDAVQRRTREIGLRLALGARRAQVARLVCTEAVALAAAGLLTGTAVAVAFSYAARSFVHGLPTLDVVTLAAAAGALTIVTAVAAIVPLRRALRVNPNIALRAE